MEVRRLKSRYRRIAYLARQEGETVYFNHQSITIGENTYDATQLSQIPDKYKTESIDRRRPQQAMDVVTKPTIDPAKTTEVQVMDTGEPAKVSVPDKVLPGPDKETTKAKETVRSTDKRRVNRTTAKLPKVQVTTGANRYEKDELPKRNRDFSQGGTVNMRLTKHGLLFSGPTAFPSNMYKRDFYDDDNAKCVSVEHRYCFLEAMFNKDFDLALALTNPEISGFEAKNMCKTLPKNPLLKAISVPTLKRLMVKKFEQNPDLLQDLIDTAPHRLIEASWDLLWGGGKPFDSTYYDDGTFVGVNKFGDMATSWRDEIIATIQAKNKNKK